MTETHPLEPVALKALEANGHDAMSLGVHMAGRGPLPSPLRDAYKSVAQDVLDSLEKRGLAAQDDMGWYYLAKDGKIVERAE
jgi:ribosomal protein S19E (S16A)